MIHATANTLVVDDLNLILSRLREGLLLADPAAVEALIGPVQQWAESLQADGGWGDIDYADRNTGPWKPTEHLDRALAMARPFHTRRARRTEPDRDLE